MTTSAAPLVSCIMPTANRRAFAPYAIAYFLGQDYPHKELVIVDDGEDSIADLVPTEPRVGYLRLTGRLTVGAKRNLACGQARGAIIAHWDDDDWHAPHRLSYQVEALQRSGADLCGIQQMLFYDLRDARAWRYVYPSSWPLWLSGSTLCYTRAFWSANHFAPIDVDEDASFVAAARGDRVVVLPNSSFHVGMIHGGNVSPKHIDSGFWQPHPAEDIRRVLGEDWENYRTDQMARRPLLRRTLRDATAW